MSRLMIITDHCEGRSASNGYNICKSFFFDSEMSINSKPIKTCHKPLILSFPLKHDRKYQLIDYRRPYPVGCSCFHLKVRKTNNKQKAAEEAFVKHKANMSALFLAFALERCFGSIIAEQRETKISFNDFDLSLS